MPGKRQRFPSLRAANKPARALEISCNATGNSQRYVHRLFFAAACGSSATHSPVLTPASTSIALSCPRPSCTWRSTCQPVGRACTGRSFPRAVLRPTREHTDALHVPPATVQTLANMHGHVAERNRHVGHHARVGRVDDEEVGLDIGGAGQEDQGTDGACAGHGRLHAWRPIADVPRQCSRGVRAVFGCLADFGKSFGNKRYVRNLER